MVGTHASELHKKHYYPADSPTCVLVKPSQVCQVISAVGWPQPVVIFFLCWLQRAQAELEKLQEKERVRAGKELLEAKRKEDELQLKRNLEQRRIEKAEEAQAREKIRVKLGTSLDGTLH